MFKQRVQSSLKRAACLGAFLAFLPGCEFRGGWNSPPEATPMPASYIPPVSENALTDRPNSPGGQKPGIAAPGSNPSNTLPRDGGKLSQPGAPSPSPSPKPSPSPEPQASPDPSPTPDPSQQDPAGGAAPIDPGNPPNIADAAQALPPVNPQDPAASPTPSADEPQLNLSPPGGGGSGDLAGALSAPPSPDELQKKFFDYLAELTDPISGDYIYAADADVAAAASNLVAAQINYDQFVAIHDFLRNLWDDQANDYIFRGTTAVERAQDACTRKVQADPLKQAVDYFKVLMDRNQNYLLTMPQVALLSIEVVAQPNFKLETFSNDYSQAVIVEETSVTLIQSVLVRENIQIDWGKVTSPVSSPAP